jgi:hypothetical protein
MKEYMTGSPVFFLFLGYHHTFASQKVACGSKTCVGSDAHPVNIF